MFFSIKAGYCVHYFPLLLRAKSRLTTTTALFAQRHDNSIDLAYLTNLKSYGKISALLLNLRDTF